MQAQWQVSQPNRQVYAYRREIQVLVRLPNERARREMVAFRQDRSKMDGSILLAGSINQGDVYRRQRTRRTTGKTWLFPPTKGDTKTTSTSTRKAVLRYTPLPLNTNRSNVSPLPYLSTSSACFCDSVTYFLKCLAGTFASNISSSSRLLRLAISGTKK